MRVPPNPRHRTRRRVMVWTMTTTRRYLWSILLAVGIVLGSVPWWDDSSLVVPVAGLLALVAYEAVWWGHVNDETAPPATKADGADRRGV